MASKLKNMLFYTIDTCIKSMNNITKNTKNTKNDAELSVLSLFNEKLTYDLLANKENTDSVSLKSKSKKSYVDLSLDLVNTVPLNVLKLLILQPNYKG